MKTDIWFVIWYDQKLRALPAHSMTTVGLRPLKATDFHSSEGRRSCSQISEALRDCLQTGQMYGAWPAKPWLFAHRRQMAWLRGRMRVCGGALGSGVYSPAYGDDCLPRELGTALLYVAIEALFHSEIGGVQPKPKQRPRALQGT